VFSGEANVTDSEPAVVIFASDFAVMTNVYLLSAQVPFSTVDMVMSDNIYHKKMGNLRIYS
jgi:hypothetical protein